MSILWTRWRRCVDDDGDEDHVDEDIGYEVSAMTLQRCVNDNVSLEGVPRGDQVSMPCRDAEGDEDCILLHTGLACGWCMSWSLLVDVLDEVCWLVA